ncbi:MAG: TRAP-type C4-dicarboxylate transport system, substrate-binding protein [bacterium]|nr:TRAP-type C4-dicarboxylate transport system, substrate-binding protein [bacterium]
MSAAARLVLVVAAVAAAGAARAEPIVLRFGTVAPDGTAWARIARQTSTALFEATEGQVTSKWYFGGIAGDELQMLERTRKDQLDGIVSAGMLCERLSPSMRVMRMVGLFQTRDESGYVAGRLKPLFDEDFRKQGFVNLGDVGIGPDMVFSREPIHDMAELRKTKLWTWSLDEVFVATWPMLGMHVVPLPIDQAYRAYENHAVDGFLAVPTAALGFQWSTEARYVTDLRVAFLRACILISTRSFDPLPLEARNALLNSSAKGMMQLENLGRAQDEQLLGGLFAKQGLKTVPTSEAFRADFFAQARAAREQIAAAGKLVRPDLVQRVLTLLADYRAEHRAVDGDSNR